MKHWLQSLFESRTKKRIEDALKCVHECQWQGTPATPISLAGALGLSIHKMMKLSQRMQAHGLIRIHKGTLLVTPQGEQLALQVIRAHRLWERFLVDEARMPLADVHAVADRKEHQRTTQEMHTLDAALGYPSTDPHGDPIPTSNGILHRDHSVPLTEWPIGKYALIVHLEDEPVAIFSQIAAFDLYPGQRIKIISADDRRIVFSDDHKECTLAPIVAANIHVTSGKPKKSAQRSVRLNTLQVGQSATVQELDESLQGFTRRRLLDLGLTRGALVAAEYKSFLGDPVAYRVRGALIALRRDQASKVLVQLSNEEEVSRG